jgi:hypothetical protein
LATLSRHGGFGPAPDGKRLLFARRADQNAEVVVRLNSSVFEEVDPDWQLTAAGSPRR